VTAVRTSIIAVDSLRRVNGFHTDGPVHAEKVRPRRPGNCVSVSRLRQQIFLVGLMVAFTAAYSALAPLSFGKQLRRRADQGRRRMLRRTRRRLVRARALVARRLRAGRTMALVASNSKPPL